MKRCTSVLSILLGISVYIAMYMIPPCGSSLSAACPGYAAASDTVKSKEKYKERKGEMEKELIEKTKEKKGGPDRTTEETRYEQVSEEESSDWFTCLFDILGFVCSIMGDSEPDEIEEDAVLEPEPVEPAAPDSGAELEAPETDAGTGAELEAPETDAGTGDVAATGGLPYTATVMPISAGETAVLLWDEPGGEKMNAAVIDTLAMGIEVSVMIISRIENIYWVKIETVSKPKITGWVDEREVSPIEQPDTRK